jgi:hypothetical protein
LWHPLSLLLSFSLFVSLSLSLPFYLSLFHFLSLFLSLCHFLFLFLSHCTFIFCLSFAHTHTISFIHHFPWNKHFSKFSFFLFDLSRKAIYKFHFKVGNSGFQQIFRFCDLLYFHEDFYFASYQPKEIAYIMCSSGNDIVFNIASIYDFFFCNTYYQQTIKNLQLWVNRFYLEKFFVFWLFLLSWSSHMTDPTTTSLVWPVFNTSNLTKRNKTQNRW